MQNIKDQMFIPQDVSSLESAMDLSVGEAYYTLAPRVILRDGG